MKKLVKKILERLEERTDFLSDCTKYGNKDAKQQGNSYSTMMLYEVADLVEDLKAIVQEVAEEYNVGWIPCSERLPEEELEKAMRERGENAVFPVLATINKVHLISGEKYKIVSRAFYGQYNDKNFYNSCCDRLDVIAWQPLPEPYQPKGE